MKYLAALLLSVSIVNAPVAQADSHDGQHLECWTVADGNVYCDWYYND